MSDADPILARAVAMAEEVAAAAIVADGMAGFHGAIALPGEPPSYQVFGGDYYEGSAGVARMLLWTGRLAERPALIRLARKALRHALERSQSQGWSLHSGLLGNGLVAIEAGGLLASPGLQRAGIEAVRRALEAALDEARAGTAALDYLAGLAGAVHAAVALAKARISDPQWFLRMALNLAEPLAAAGEPAEVGRAWRMHPADPGPLLAGLAHGAAGIALAFAALAAIDPEQAEHWHGLAAEARAFERIHVSSHRGSWADLRTQGDSSGPGSCPHFWCHGSVGIAHERLLAWRAHPGDALITTDLAIGLAGARAAAAALLAGPVGPGAGEIANGSLCHGAAGLIDLLVATGEADDRVLAQRLSAFMDADRRARSHPRSGMPGGWGTPGLMLGSAGIAWGHLRAARPDVVPAGWDPASGLAQS